MDNTEKNFVRGVLQNGQISLKDFKELYKNRFNFYPTYGGLARLLISYDKDNHPIVTGFDSDIDSNPERLIIRAKEIKELGL